MPRFIRDLFTGELKELPFEGSYREVYGDPGFEKIPRDAIRSDKPWVSRSMAVHPNEVSQMNDQLKQYNISGHFRNDGKFETESRSGRREVMRLRGFLDRDAGYGDWAGK